MKQANDSKPDEGGERWMLPLHIYHKHITAKTWRMCDACGELSPQPGDGCPFCADMLEGLPL